MPSEKPWNHWRDEPGQHGVQSHPWPLSSRGRRLPAPVATVAGLWWLVDIGQSPELSQKDFTLKEKVTQSFTSKAAGPGHLAVWHRPRQASPDASAGRCSSAYLTPAIYCALSVLKYIYDALYEERCVCVFLAGRNCWTVRHEALGTCPWVPNHLCRGIEDTSPLQECRLVASVYP